VAEAFYVPEDDGAFRATEFTRGPWSREHQHAGPPAALLARAIAAASGIPGGQTARITFDILRPIPIDRLTVETEVLRPGRRVEQLRAVLRHDGQDLMRATAWRLRSADLAAVAARSDPPPPMGNTHPVDLPWWEDEVAYHRAFEWRLESGTIEAPGPATIWTRQTVDLVAGERPAPLDRLLAMADAASGVSWQLPWDEYQFPNVDLSMHLERQPVGDWMAMDAVTRVGPAGAGQCTAVLFDSRGRVGTSAQTLLIERR
jgi:hypothetical protein